MARTSSDKPKDNNKDKETGKTSNSIRKLRQKSSNQLSSVTYPIQSQEMSQQAENYINTKHSRKSSPNNLEISALKIRNPPSIDSLSTFHEPTKSNSKSPIPLPDTPTLNTNDNATEDQTRKLTKVITTDLSNLENLETPDTTTSNLDTMEHPTNTNTFSNPPSETSARLTPTSTPRLNDHALQQTSSTTPDASETTTTNHNYFTTENPPNNNKPTCPNSTPKQSSFSKPLSLSDSTSTSPKPNWADYPSSSSSSASSSSSDTSDSSQQSSDDDDKLESSSTGDEENQDSSESVATSEHTSRSEDSEDLDSELPGSINFSFPSNPLVEDDQSGETLTTMDDSSSLINNQIITVSNANHNSTTFVIKKGRQNYLKTPPLQSKTTKKHKSRSQTNSNTLNIPSPASQHTYPTTSTTKLYTTNATTATSPTQPCTFNTSTTTTSTTTTSNLQPPQQTVSLSALNILPITLSTNMALHTKTTAKLTTQLLLISRIPIAYTLQEITGDLNMISNMLGADIDTSELAMRYNETTLTHAYIRDGSRIGILVQLTSTHNFCTTGNFYSHTLPLFFFSASSRSEGLGTTRRLTVQALPTTNLHQLSSTTEVCCIRCLPDNAHTISAIFSLLWRDLLETLGNLPLLPILTSTKTNRPTGPFVDEVFLRIHIFKDIMEISKIQIQTALNLQTFPIHHHVLSWHGEIAKSFRDFLHSPTNNFNLIYNPTILQFGNISQSTEDLLHIIEPFINTPISYVYQIHGKMDSPWLPNTSSILVLVSQHIDGSRIDFDFDGWALHQPLPITPTHKILFGYEVLPHIYMTNPPPAPLSHNRRPLPVISQGGARISSNTILRNVPPTLVTPRSSTPGRSTSTQHMNSTPSSTTTHSKTIPSRPSTPLKVSFATSTTSSSGQHTYLQAANNNSSISIPLARLEAVEQAVLRIDAQNQSLVTSRATDTTNINQIMVTLNGLGALIHNLHHTFSMANPNLLHHNPLNPSYPNTIVNQSQIPPLTSLTHPTNTSYPNTTDNNSQTPPLTSLTHPTNPSSPNTTVNQSPQIPLLTSLTHPTNPYYPNSTVNHSQTHPFTYSPYPTNPYYPNSTVNHSQTHPFTFSPYPTNPSYSNSTVNHSQTHPFTYLAPSLNGGIPNFTTFSPYTTNTIPLPIPSSAPPPSAASRTNNTPNAP